MKMAEFFLGVFRPVKDKRRSSQGRWGTHYSELHLARPPYPRNVCSVYSNLLNGTPWAIQLVRQCTDSEFAEYMCTDCSHASYGIESFCTLLTWTFTVIQFTNWNDNFKVQLSACSAPAKCCHFLDLLFNSHGSSFDFACTISRVVSLCENIWCFKLLLCVFVLFFFLIKKG